MNQDDPIAYFITWTIYGSHLQGDVRGWRRRCHGEQAPAPRLAEWRRERLRYEVLTLTTDQRQVVETECTRHCAHRNWKLWAVNARTNHIHSVDTAMGHSGNIVRDQLKANATRGLRERWNSLAGRPIWSVGGDWECINSLGDLEAVCHYVLEGQDRKGRDSTGG